MGGVFAAVLFTLATGGVVAGVVVATRRAARRRTEALTESAKRLGWGFLAHVPFDALPDLDRFELFASGHSKKVANVMTSPASDVHRVVFDFTYVVGAGKHRVVHQQTVFYAAGEALRLPSFSLRPESFFHKVGELFGYKDIDFEERPEFSKDFLLRSEDEIGVRRAFHEDVLRFFERRTGVCSAGTGRELLYWRPRGFAPADSVEDLIGDGDELAKLLAER